MRKLKMGAGVVALVLVIAGAGYAVTTYLASIDPAVDQQTGLPLARI